MKAANYSGNAQQKYCIRKRSETNRENRQDTRKIKVDRLTMSFSTARLYDERSIWRRRPSLPFTFWICPSRHFVATHGVLAQGRSTLYFFGGLHKRQMRCLGIYTFSFFCVNVFTLYHPWDWRLLLRDLAAASLGYDFEGAACFTKDGGSCGGGRGALYVRRSFTTIIRATTIFRPSYLILSKRLSS